MQRSILHRLSAVCVLLFSAVSWSAHEAGRDPVVPDLMANRTSMSQAPNVGGPDPTALALVPIRSRDVALAVQKFVGREVRARDGFCRIEDPVEKTSLDLNLKHIYIKPLAKTGPDTYLTSAVFEGADGTPYEVDFHVQGTTRFNLTVVDATIRAKNGLQRYAWASEKGLRRVMPLSSEMPMREELAH